MIKEQEIIEAIAEHLGLSPDDLDRHALLREELNLGPIELNDLLTHMAREFDISFDPEETADVKKIEDLVALIEDNLLD
ncbi:MAG: acyl carrier protein [Candidatus Daviesbacteria bacterium]|nr:acyl carrier protein [Candidatus Daviesbacteria bacterium]